MSTAPTPARRGTLWRLVDALTWVFLAYIVYTLYQQNTTDPHDFISVGELYISDHVVEGDPTILFEPDIRREFWATRTARIHPSNLAATACQSAERVFYTPEDDFTGYTLRRFMDADCLLLPGQYTLRVSWLPDNSETIRTKSNTFRVVENFEELEALITPPIPEVSTDE